MLYINGLVQDYSNPIANALELLQSCTKPSVYTTTRFCCLIGWLHDHMEWILNLAISVTDKLVDLDPFHTQLTHWGRDKMAAIFQKTFSNAFSWMKMYEFWLWFHWSLFLRVHLIIFQHWFACTAPSHYLKQWWPSLLMHIYVTWPQRVNEHRIEILWKLYLKLSLAPDIKIYVMLIDNMWSILSDVIYAKVCELSFVLFLKLPAPWSFVQCLPCSGAQQWKQKISALLALCEENLKVAGGIMGSMSYYLGPGVLRNIYVTIHL